MIVCMGDCGKRLEAPGMCWECVEGGRILNRNAIKNARAEGKREMADRLLILLDNEDLRLKREWGVTHTSAADFADKVRDLLDAPEGKPR